MKQYLVTLSITVEVEAVDRFVAGEHAIEIAQNGGYDEVFRSDSLVTETSVKSFKELFDDK